MKTCVHNFKNNCVTDRRRIKTFLLPALVLIFLLIAGKGWSQFSEGFEGGALPPGWTQTYISGTQNWVYQAGAYSGAVTTAHSGNYNAMFQSTSWNNNKTMIFTPAIDLSSYSSATLTFWHTQQSWGSDQGILTVYYKTSAGGSWVQLAQYTNSISTWTQETILLPNINSTYYIGFQGHTNYDYGICLDDVAISSSGSDPSSGPCASAITMQCGVTYNATLNPSSGFWDNYNGTNYNYTGSEQVWEFTAPVTGSYTFNVAQGTADADFFFMSDCDPYSTNLSSGYWTGSGSGTSHTLNLIGGTTYYLIADLYSYASSSTTVTVSVDCPAHIPADNCPDYANTVSSSNSHCSNQTYYLEILNTDCDGEIYFDVVGNYGSSYAYEITWEVVSNLTDNVIASGGPGTNGANIFTTVGPIDANIQGSVFKIIVYDSYGDGFSSGGNISVQQSGVDICTPITGNFGSQAHAMFMPNFVISSATITVSTPSGDITQTVVNCNDFRVPLTINTDLFCSTSSIDLPWEITCDDNSSVISSGTHNMTIYPNTPNTIDDIVEISFDADNCEWVTNWQNDCTVDDLGLLFDILPNPTATIDACTAHSPQTFTLQYHGISGGLDCCSTAGASSPLTYTISTSNTSVESSPYGGTNNSAYLTLPGNGTGGNATALELTFNMSGYCFIHPYGDVTNFWITIIVDGNVVYDQMFNDPATSANITFDLADISGGYNQNSVIEVYVYPNTFSAGGYNTTFIPGGNCNSISTGQWTAGSFNLSINATFEEMAPTPLDCEYIDNINQPCCNVYPVSNVQDEICSGESFDIQTWQDLVDNANERACIYYSSVIPIGGSVAPDGVLPDGTNSSSDTITQTVSAYSYCDANGNGTVDAGDTYTLLSTYYLTVNPIITPVFTQLGPYCAGDTPDILPTTSNNGITGTWSPTTINTDTAQITNYTFTPTTGQCATSTSITITVEPNTTPTFTPVGPYCSGDIIPPLATTSNNGITGTWSPTINNTATTTYTFTPTSGTCVTTTTLTIVISPDIIPIFTPVGPYCLGDVIPPLPTTSNNGITGTWSPEINSIETTTYTFTPTTGHCTPPQTLTIIVSSNPIVSITGNNLLCNAGKDGLINVTISDGTPQYTVNWGANSTTILGSSYTIPNLSAGQYKVLVTDANGCTSSATTNLLEPSKIEATVISENPSCIGNNNGSIKINVNGGTSPYLYTWSGGEPPVHYLSELREGTYIVTITDANQCIYELNPIILTDVNEDCLRIPNAFTPNNDGINDTWVIGNIEMFPNASLYIFNRWGQELYHTKGSENPWDGTYNGKFVPTGTYLYIINLHTGAKPYTGSVSVVY